MIVGALRSGTQDPPHFLGPDLHHHAGKESFGICTPKTEAQARLTLVWAPRGVVCDTFGLFVSFA